MKSAPLLVVMGVSGVGKSTVGRQLSQALSIPFIDADDFCPKEAVQKMSSGIPLEDEDRAPWFDILNHQLRSYAKKNGVVLACSALKKAYRDHLETGCRITWIYLHGEKDLILERMNQRKGHFMPTSLLDSQFATLEPPDKAVAVHVGPSPEKLVMWILGQLP